VEALKNQIIGTPASGTVSDDSRPSDPRSRLVHAADQLQSDSLQASLQQRLRTAGDSTMEAARPASVQEATTTAHRTVEKIADVAAQASETVTHKTHELSDQFKNAQAEAMYRGRKYIYQHPLVALGMALLSGTFIGLMLTRRSRHPFTGASNPLKHF